MSRSLRTIPCFGLRGKLIALLGEEAAQAEYLRQFRRWESGRKMLDSENIHPTPVDQLEALLDQTQRVYDEMELPPNLTPIDAALMKQEQSRGHRPTHGRLGHSRPTATHQQGTLATQNPLRCRSERVSTVGLTGFEPATT